MKFWLVILLALCTAAGLRADTATHRRIVSVQACDAVIHRSGEGVCDPANVPLVATAAEAAAPQPGSEEAAPVKGRHFILLFAEIAGGDRYGIWYSPSLCRTHGTFVPFGGRPCDRYVLALRKIVI